MAKPKDHNTTVFDFETAGIDHSSLVFTLSAVRFNRFNLDWSTLDDVKMDKFDVKLNLGQQIFKGRVIEESCINNFWAKLPEEVRNEAIFGITLNVEKALLLFFEFSAGTQVYCRGTDFDPPKLVSLCKQFGVKCPIEYNAFRDIRSYVDALTGESSGIIAVEGDLAESLRPHVSMDDCIKDALGMVLAYRNNRTSSTKHKIQ